MALIGNCMTLLQQREGDRMRVREEIRAETRAKLKMALSELLPGAKVLVFGSLTQSGKFNANSDVDIALFEEPTTMTLWGIMAELMERLGRPVDVLMLFQCRFRDRLLKEGEIWIG